MPEDQTQKPRKERKANADRRRQQLLDATLRSIVTNGLAKTTLATVANEAGLSQGVAVFYFKSKTGLLTEALREQYHRYEDNWTAALDRAGDDPLDRLIAVIRADFDPVVCNPETLSIWFAFWGEQKFTPSYADITAAFDAKRTAAIRGVCGALMGATSARSDQISNWIDTLTDGFWQNLHLFPKTCTVDHAVTESLALVAALLPDHAARLTA